MCAIPTLYNVVPSVFIKLNVIDDNVSVNEYEVPLVNSILGLSVAATVKSSLANLKLLETSVAE